MSRSWVYNLAPDEYILSDGLEVCRAHHVVGIAQRCTLASTRPILPPPVSAGPSLFLYCVEGFLRNLGLEARDHSHDHWVFDDASASPVVACTHPGCSQRAYNRESQAVRQCPSCHRWMHEGCLDLSPSSDSWPRWPVSDPTPDEEGDDSADEPFFEPPPVRRAPRQDAAPLVTLARGLRHPLLPSIASWERVTAALFHVYGQEFEEDDEELWEEWVARVRSEPDGTPAPVISEAAANAALHALIPSSLSTTLPVFSCPHCSAAM